MKNLDLEKIIIILSLLLMPAVGAWIYMLDGDLVKVDRAMASRQPMIQEIHSLHRLIQKTKESLQDPEATSSNVRVYFQNRLVASQKGGESFLSRDQITVNEGRSFDVLRGRTKIAKDIEVKVEFAKGVRGGLTLPRSFVNACIVNCESRTPIWKLRSLKIENKDFRGLRGNAVPPLETADEWFVREMNFARRKPADK